MALLNWKSKLVLIVFFFSPAKQKRDIGFAFPASSLSTALAALTFVEFSGSALFLRNDTRVMKLCTSLYLVEGG